MNKKKLHLIIGGIITLIAVVIIVALIPRSTIVLSVAPEEFTVSINDGSVQKKKTGEQLTVLPGTYKITITSNEFGSYTTTVTVKNYETYEILYALTPQTDNAQRLLETDRSQAIIQRIAGQKMNSEIESMEKNYPIVNSLPIYDKFFTISSCSSEKYPNDTTKLAICVDLYEPEAKETAIQMVKDKGFDLNDYETRFITAEDEHDH